jgi:hypothetical protein
MLSSFRIYLVLIGLIANICQTHAEEKKPSEKVIREAIQKSLPLLWEGMEGHSDANRCFSCHNHGVPLLTFSIVKQHGFAVDPERLQKQIQHIEAFFKSNYREEKGFLPTGGRVSTTGWGLLSLASFDIKATPVIDAVVEYTLKEDGHRDHWTPAGNRPPSEGSHFMTTYVGLRALKNYPNTKQEEAFNKRTEKVRGWLKEAKPKDNEDRVFRLMALQLLNETTLLDEAIQSLKKLQRPDGSWSQLDETKEGDPYATGIALTVLALGGKQSTQESWYQQGLQYLLQSQQPDGSWHVKTRARPVQKYFESGFPHGKDQFISCAATGWATSALALSLPLKK